MRDIVHGVWSMGPDQIIDHWVSLDNIADIHVEREDVQKALEVTVYPRIQVNGEWETDLSTWHTYAYDPWTEIRQLGTL